MSAWIELPVTEIAERYRAGENTLELGCAYDVSYATIRQRLRAVGVKLRPRGAQPGNKNALGNKNAARRGGPLHADGRGYLNTLDREGGTCGIHRGCWEACRGSIPNGHVIHHRDSDRQNNNPENLECLTHSQHIRLHIARKKSNLAIDSP